MNPIIQPITTTDMRRDPKSLLERVKKEKTVPILVHSQLEAVVISMDELNRLYETIKDLKHELFVQETLGAIKEYEAHGGSGPFDTMEEFEEHINKITENDEN